VADALCKPSIWIARCRAIAILATAACSSAPAITHSSALVSPGGSEAVADAAPAAVERFTFPRATTTESRGIGYHVQGSTRRRVIDVASGALSEREERFSRLESTMYEPQGASTTTVAWDNSGTSGFGQEDTQRSQGRYTISRKPGGPGAPLNFQVTPTLDPELMKEVATRERGQSTFDALVQLLTTTSFGPREPVALPLDLAKLLGTASGTVTLDAIERRWQTDVARFSIRLSSEHGTGKGELFVESMTGFPLVLRLRQRTNQPSFWQGRRLHMLTLEVINRRWARHDAVNGSTRTITANPPRPAMAYDQWVLAPDGRVFVGLNTTAGHGAQVWDLATRRITQTVNSTATALGMRDQLLILANSVAVDGHIVRKGGGLSSFGTALVPWQMVSKMGRAQAADVFQNRALVAYDDGKVGLFSPGWSCVVDIWDTGLDTIARITSDEQGYVLAGNDSGELLLLRLSIDQGRPRPKPYCPETLSAVVVGRIQAGSGRFTDLHLLADNMAAANSRGEVFVFRRSDFRMEDRASIRPRGLLGSSVRLDDASGQVAIVTERGRFPAFTPHALVPAPARVRGLGHAVTSAGNLGIALEPGTIRIFSPETGESAREATGQGIPLVALRTTADAKLEAVASKARKRHVFEWDLRTWEFQQSFSESAGEHDATESTIHQITIPSREGLLTIGLEADGTLVGRLAAREVYRSELRVAPLQPVLAASPDGRSLAIANTHQRASPFNPNIPVVQVVDSATGKPSLILSPRWLTLTALAFIEGGSALAGGTADGEIAIWDIATGQLIEQFVAHESAITAIVTLRSNARWASASLDGTVRIWDQDALSDALPKGKHQIYQEVMVPARPTKLVATLFADESGGAMIATADGYYKSSRGVVRALELESAWAKYEFEQFDRELNRPDIVLERLGTPDAILALYQAAHRKNEARGRQPPTFQSLTQPPEVGVNGVPLGFTTRRRLELSITARAAAGRQLSRLFLRVNSVPLTPPEGVPLSGTDALLTYPVDLAKGTNRIESYVLDGHGVPSRMVTQVVDLVGVERPPELYVLAVGVTALNLKSAASDARDLAALLSRSRQFGRVHTKVLIDSQATRGNILGAQSFLASAQVDDTVLIFLAGHGFLDRNLEYYFVTADTDPSEPTAQALRYDALSDLVSKLAARQRVLVIDTCHSGEVDAEILPQHRKVRKIGTGDARVRRTVQAPVAPWKSFALMQELFGAQRSANGAIVIASTAGADLAFGAGHRPNGLFTSTLLDGLSNPSADADRDGRVRLTELMIYVRARVSELSRGAQQPIIRAENLDMDLVLY
jgi:hypothetical protein